MMLQHMDRSRLHPWFYTKATHLPRVITAQAGVESNLTRGRSGMGFYASCIPTTAALGCCRKVLS